MNSETVKLLLCSWAYQMQLHIFQLYHLQDYAVALAIRPIQVSKSVDTCGESLRKPLTLSPLVANLSGLCFPVFNNFPRVRLRPDFGRSSACAFPERQKARHLVSMLSKPFSGPCRRALLFVRGDEEGERAVRTNRAPDGPDLEPYDFDSSLRGSWRWRSSRKGTWQRGSLTENCR